MHADTALTHGKIDLVDANTGWNGRNKVVRKYGITSPLFHVMQGDLSPVTCLPPAPPPPPPPEEPPPPLPEEEPGGVAAEVMAESNELPREEENLSSLPGSQQSPSYQSGECRDPWVRNTALPNRFATMMASGDGAGRFRCCLISCVVSATGTGVS